MAPTFRPAIMSASLGQAWLHDFDNKATIAAKDGLQGIEIFYEDLEYFARKDHNTETPTSEQLVQAAEHVHRTCSAAGLTIIGLQPFLFYEGLLDRAKHDEHIVKIKLWFRIAHALHTDIIQIPGNFLPADQLSGNFDVIAADLGLQQTPMVRFAYENLCWNTHVDTWEKAWDVCRRVDRPNFGLCLDTFNIAGRVWADPTMPTGRAGNDEQAASAALAASVAALVRKVDLAKVFYIQVVDAERLKAPLVEGCPSRAWAAPSLSSLAIAAGSPWSSSRALCPRRAPMCPRSTRGGVLLHGKFLRSG
jgi:4-hydroxyphenylpyruvate dioxygenase